MQPPDLFDPPLERRPPTLPEWPSPTSDPFQAMTLDADKYERGAEQYERAAQVLSERARVYRDTANRERPGPALASAEPSGLPMHADITDHFQAMRADGDMYERQAEQYRQASTVLRDRAKVYRRVARERGRPATSPMAPPPQVDRSDPLSSPLSGSAVRSDASPSTDPAIAVGVSS